MVELTAVKWLYCFACHTSQEHELCDDGNYKCPNCGMKRAKTFETFDELMKILNDADFDIIAQKGTHEQNV